MAEQIEEQQVITTECGHTINRHWSWPSRIKNYTLDCTVCGTLLVMVSETEARDFNKYLHEKDPQWPIDGKGTGYVEFMTNGPTPQSEQTPETIEALWEQCKRTDFITGDGRRIMVTREQLEFLVEQQRDKAREAALDACAMGH